MSDSNLCKEERDDDQPDDFVGHGRKSLCKGEGLGDNACCDSEEGPGPDWERVKDQTQDRRRKDCQ